MEPVEPTYRAQVLAFLLLVSCPKQQEQLKKIIAADDIPLILTQLWFDHIYKPSLRYFDCMKGDISDREILEFESYFNQEELEATRRFHTFFEIRLGLILDGTYSFDEGGDSDYWQHTVTDAICALQEFVYDEHDYQAQNFILTKISKLGEKPYARLINDDASNS